MISLNFCKVIGKFGKDAKLSKTIKVQSGQDVLADGRKISQINLDLRALADKCLPSTLRNRLEIKQTENLDYDMSKIVEISHDVRLKVQDDCVFSVHNVF